MIQGITCLPLFLPILVILLSKDIVTMALISLPDYLLPDDVLPLEYHLTIVPYMSTDAAFYDCSLIINLRCQRKTNYFRFHSGKNLNLTADKFTLVDTSYYGHKLKTKISYDANHQQFTVSLSEALRPGQTLSLTVQSFRAPYNSKKAGIFRYPKKKRIQMVLTQFQENDARSAFPCFDEPRFKASFSLIIYRQKYLNVVTRANAALNYSYAIYSGWIADVYEKTIPIPTYVVSFVAFKSRYFRIVTNNIFAGGKIIKVGLIYNERVTQIKHSSQMNCTSCMCSTNKLFGAIKTSIDFMSKYLNSSYPMKKYDVVMTRSSPYTGMENMGLVLIKALSGCSFRVHAHEVIHQWIGNVVSPFWWGDLWLSEGLTTYFTGRVVQTHYPKLWKRVSFAVTHDIITKMPTDAAGFLPTVSHRQVKQLDKKIGAVYSKASAIIHMLTSIIGEDVLKRTMQDYFHSNMYSNVTHHDFIATVNKFFPDTSVNLSRWIETWIHVKGFPVVTFTRYGRSIVAQQTDILRRNFTWRIPLTWSKNCDEFINWDWSAMPMKYFMNETRVTLPVTVEANECFIGNPHFQGYYLPIYDAETWLHLHNMWLDLADTFNSTSRHELYRKVTPFRILLQVPSAFIAQPFMDKVTKQIFEEFLYSITDKYSVLREVLSGTPRSKKTTTQETKSNSKATRQQKSYSNSSVETLPAQ